MKKKEPLSLLKQYKLLKQGNLESDIKKDFGVTGGLPLKTKVVFKKTLEDIIINPNRY